MTDKHAGYVVTLAKDIREDDAEAILMALSMVKGVLSVKPIIGGLNLIMAQERVRNHLVRNVLELLKTPISEWSKVDA